ncbi:alpha/beta fold hydrolase [Fredinandcohnia sp. QZ13]|uniref:acetylxylan esterase n=1 Tax=Fredinandcohnia sp. QZ13 TaxID=3073144 RepID=UPI002852FD15|nr:alpha/beta fold hydrolase [Fredinandcohnia sp. QZ13]MDR4890082.1 alpha/beta fold hydrolase [Fredinandcohnia sp. QZ13]
MKEYETYKPPLTKTEDFHTFWENTLDESNRLPIQSALEREEYPIKQVDVYRVTYQGFGGTPIRGFYILPKETKENLPCIVMYHGYGMDKGSASNYMKWVMQGIAVLAIDHRGHGESSDDSGYMSGTNGTWILHGILNKEEYYYRKVYMDSKRAIDFIFSRPEIDKSRVCIYGGSMGGGVALAVAALDHRPKLVIADVPNMCNSELAIQQKQGGSLLSLEGYLARYPEKAQQVFHNLTYFDNLNFASMIKSKIRVAVGLKDIVCPPKAIFGVYNHIEADKSIVVYPFTGHDIGSLASHLDDTLYYVSKNL